MKVGHREFRSWLVNVRAACQRACEFASTLERERVISISHSGNRVYRIVVVWYWEE